MRETDDLSLDILTVCNRHKITSSRGNIGILELLQNILSWRDINNDGSDICNRQKN